jgi:hypothetical protein
LGGDTVTTTVEGRERYSVNVRYPRDLRSNPQAIAKEVLIPIAGGGTVPLGEVASVTLSRGPTTIRTEDGQLAAYIFVDIRDRDLGGYVAEAQKAVAANVVFPAGYYAGWSGQFEYLQRAEARLKIVVPFTLMIIFLLLYLNFRALTGAFIVMLSLPFALVGGVWMLWWLGFNFSVAVAVGMIALAGVAAETGVVMLIYLDHALAEIRAERAAQGLGLTRADIRDAIMLGAVERVRPKMMTVVAIMAGLLPILWSTGTGSEVMQRIAVPMIGGMMSSTILTLVVIPAIYAVVKGWRRPRSTQSRAHRCDDSCENAQRIGRTAGFAFFKVLVFLTHGVGDVGQAQHLRAAGLRERIKGGGLHFDREHTFGLGGLDGFLSFAKWRVRGPGRTDGNIPIRPQGCHCGRDQTRVRVAVLGRWRVVIAGAFIAQCAVDDHELRRAMWRNLASRRYAQ